MIKLVLGVNHFSQSKPCLNNVIYVFGIFQTSSLIPIENMALRNRESHSLAISRTHGQRLLIFQHSRKPFSIIFKTTICAMKLLCACYWQNFFSQCKNCQSQSQILVTHCQFLPDWKWMDSPLWRHCYKADRNFPKRILVNI